MLKLIIPEFEIIVSGIGENIEGRLTPQEQVTELAYQKARDEVKVFLKDISDEEIEKWIKTGKAMDKARAYAIQEEFCVFIEKIEGNYHTVVGLPTHKVYEILKKYILGRNVK